MLIPLFANQWRWLLSISLPLLCYFFLLPDAVFADKQKFFLAITLWAALNWALETLPEAVVGLAVPLLFLMTKLATPAQIFSPWLSSVPWAILGGLAMGSVLLETGLATRLAYRCVLLCGSSFPSILAGILLAGMLIAPFMPSALGKMAIMSVIGIGLCKVLHLPAKSKAASAIMLTCFFAVSCPALSYATGGLHVAIVVGFLNKALPAGLGWLDYAYHNWLVGTLYAVASLGLVLLMFKPEQPLTDPAAIRRRHRELGPVTAQEQKAVAFLLLIIAGFLTDRLHGLDSAWIMMLALVAFFLPGIGLMNREQFGRLGFPLLFFITGAMSIGSTAMITGLSQKTAELMLPLLSASPAGAAFFSYGFGFVSSFFMQSVALVGVFSPPLIDAATSLGMQPQALLYSFLRGTDQAIFPYQFAVLAYVCSFGYIAYRHCLWVMSIRVIVDTILFFGLALPYWSWIGLL